LEELAKEYEGKVDIYKVNVDSEQQLAEEFDIRSIPTLLFIPKVGLPQTRLGAMPTDQLREVFDRMTNL
jgi:thioredoxin-like negative regulator of GroEL